MICFLRVVLGIEQFDGVSVGQVGGIGHLAVDAIAPAGVVTVIAGAPLGAIRGDNGGDVVAADDLVAVGFQHLPSGINSGHPFGLISEQAVDELGAVRCVAGEGIGLAFVRGGLAAIGAGDDDGDRDDLIVQLLELDIVRMLFCISAQSLAGEPAGDGDCLGGSGLSDQQVFVGDDGGIAGAEGSPLFRLIPAIHVHRHDAVVDHVIYMIDPGQLALLVQVRFTEGVEVGGDVVFVRIVGLDAVEVVGFDLFHQGDLFVHFFLSQGGNLDLESTGHRDAAGLVGDGDGHGDHLGRSARHVPIDPDAGGIVHIRFFQHVIVAGGDGDGAVFAVDTEVTGAGDADVLGGGVDTIGIGGQLRAGDPIAQADLCKARVYPLPQGLLHGVAAGTGGNDDVKGFGDRYAVNTVALQGGGEGHRSGDGGLVDGHLVIAVIAGGVAHFDHFFVTGGPGEIAPTQAVPVFFQHLGQGQLADVLGGDGQRCDLLFQVGAELALVPGEVGVPLLFCRDAILLQHEGDVEIGTAAAEAVLVEVIGDGAVFADAGAAVAGRVLFDGQLDAIQLVAQLLGGEVDEVGVGTVDGVQVAGHGFDGCVQGVFRLRLTQGV